VRKGGCNTTSLAVPHRSASGISVKNPFRSDPELITYSDTMYKFKDFIMTHTRVAHEKGFEDDSKRVAGYRHFFVVPTIQQWESAFLALSDCLLFSNTERAVREVGRLTTLFYYASEFFSFANVVRFNSRGCCSLKNS